MSAPGAMGWYGMDRGGQGTPSTAKTLSKTSRPKPALPESTLVLPGDIAGNWAHFCARSRSRPPPESLIRLSGGGRDRDRVQKRAQSPAMLPGSAEVLSGNASVGLDVFDKVFAVEGAP